MSADRCSGFCGFSRWVTLTCVLALLSCSPSTRQTPEERPGDRPAGDRSALIAQVDGLADRYHDAWLEHFPELAYFAGIPSDTHDRLHDNTPAGIAAWQAIEDDLLARLSAIDPEPLTGTTAWVTHGVLRELLEASRGLRVCRTELWNVNQMNGWHQLLGLLATRQPVGTPDLRAQALTRWKAIPGFIRNEMANLRAGLAAGYSSPRSVVRLVIAQLDGIIALPVEKSPLTSPAQRDPDARFESDLKSVISGEIMPALTEYREFLDKEYLPRARGPLSVTANPDGRGCYEASLRSYTTLQRSPEEVYDLGERTVAANRARVEELGKKLYGLSDFAAIIEKVNSDPGDRFETKEQLLELSRRVVASSKEAMPRWFGTLPEKDVVVEPYAEYLEGTGVSSRYEPPQGDEPAVYRITLHQPQEQKRGNAEVTAAHEAYPGHHLQIAIAQDLDGMHKLMKISFNSGFIEGWGRYAEALGEEIGLYRSPTAALTRRAWPARGMVIDPGIHIKGWTREQAVQFIVESGRMSPDQAFTAADRVAILPGQLTAYDSGALEIFALRDLAERTLGDRFDIKAFHDRVLENGAIPLPMLRTHVEAWIAREASR